MAETLGIAMLLLSTDISLSLSSMLGLPHPLDHRNFSKETMQHLKLWTCQSEDFDAQIAYITTCYLLYTFPANFRRVNAYDWINYLRKSETN